MSFWGKIGGALKGIGKVALKAAPVAAAFIPGVGPLAAMGIGAASNAASKKLSGGSWKSALGAGALGAGTSALSGGLIGKLGSKLGAGASKGFVNSAVKGVENQVQGGSPWLNTVLGGMQMAKPIAGLFGGSSGGYQQPTPMSYSGFNNVSPFLDAGFQAGSQYSPIMRYNPSTPSTFQSPLLPTYGERSSQPPDIAFDPSSAPQQQPQQDTGISPSREFRTRNRRDRMEF